MNFMSKVYDPRKHSIFKPENIEKFVGTSYPIIRSSYELKFCKWLDMNPNVLKWASEYFEIPYFDPTSNKMRRYFPDFYMQAIDKSGEAKNYIIEIKPYKETKNPKMAGKKKKETLLYERVVWEKNQAKWKAAVSWCELRNAEFKIITEKELFKA